MIPFQTVSRERGAEIVEFSLVMIPMFRGSVPGDRPRLDAVCEGHAAGSRPGRCAVRSHRADPERNGQDSSIRTVVQQYSMGLLAGSAGASLISIAYFDPNNNLTATSSNAGGNVVQVSVAGLTVFPMAPLFRSKSPLSLSAVSSDVVEGSPGGIPPPR